MQNKRRNEKGFTLIEAIFTLLLVGVTATLAGMWIVNVANGYVFTKMNADTVQKAQLAMTRLTKEFQAIQSVSAASASAITYAKADVLSGITVTTTVSRSGANLQLGANTLTDGVSSFSLAYCDSVTSTSCPSVWSPSSRIIEITLALTGAGNTPSTFTKRIAPRNL